jgi:predicted phosphate transport protein (TIGR00153 family)
LPREERFVDHFSAHTERMVAAADALVAMMEADEKDREERFRDVCTIEGEADAITRTTIVALHRTFITPFDRSDIHSLITALDDAVDFIEEVAQHAMLYQVKEFSPRMRELAALIQSGARLLAERITALCEKVSRIESDADKLLRLALSELIAERPDSISFLGRKEVYELLEAVTDRCDDVGDVIAGIVFDHV